MKKWFSAFIAVGLVAGTCSAAQIYFNASITNDFSYKGAWFTDTGFTTPVTDFTASHILNFRNTTAANPIIIDSAWASTFTFQSGGKSMLGGLTFQNNIGPTYGVLKSGTSLFTGNVQIGGNTGNVAPFRGNLTIESGADLQIAGNNSFNLGNGQNGMGVVTIQSGATVALQHLYFGNKGQLNLQIGADWKTITMNRAAGINWEMDGALVLDIASAVADGNDIVLFSVSATSGYAGMTGALTNLFDASGVISGTGNGTFGADVYATGTSGVQEDFLGKNLNITGAEGKEWTLTYNGDALILNVSPVPEPGTSVLMLISVTGIIAVRRFRR